MKAQGRIPLIVSWILGSVIVAIGVLNLILVHAVPGIVFLLISLLYFPPADIILQKWVGYTIPFAVKIILFLIVIWFTLGISDLGDMID